MTIDDTNPPAVMIDWRRERRERIPQPLTQVFLVVVRPSMMLLHSLAPLLLQLVKLLPLIVIAGGPVEKRSLNTAFDH